MGFLTRKPTSESKQSTKQASSTPVITSPTPLYVRYSSSSNGRPDSTGSPRKLVSAPKPLGQPSGSRVDRRQSVDRFASSSASSRPSLANRSQISSPAPSTPAIPVVERNDISQVPLSTKNAERNSTLVSPAVVTSATVAASRRLSAQQLDKPLPQPISSTTNEFHPDSAQMPARTRTTSDVRPTNTRRHSRTMADNVAPQASGPSPGQFWPPPAFAYAGPNAVQSPRLASNGAQPPSSASVAVPAPQPRVMGRTPSQTKLAARPPSQRRLSGEMPQPFIVPARSLDGHSTVTGSRSTLTSPAGSPTTSPPSSINGHGSRSQKQIVSNEYNPYKSDMRMTQPRMDQQWNTAMANTQSYNHAPHHNKQTARFSNGHRDWANISTSPPIPEAYSDAPLPTEPVDPASTYPSPHTSPQMSVISPKSTYGQLPAAAQAHSAHSGSLRREISAPFKRGPLIFAAQTLPNEFEDPPPAQDAGTPYPSPPQESSPLMHAYNRSLPHEANGAALSRMDSGPKSIVGAPQQQRNSPEQTPASLAPPSVNNSGRSPRTSPVPSHATLDTPSSSTPRPGPRVLTKPKSLVHSSSSKNLKALNNPPQTLEVDMTIDRAGLDLDDDPFAKAEPVMLMPSRAPTPPSKPSTPATNLPPSNDNAEVPVMNNNIRDNKYSAAADVMSPRRRMKQPADMEPEIFTLVSIISNPICLSVVLDCLSFYEWCMLYSVSKEIRNILQDNVELRETVLLRFLRTSGYERWTFNEPEPIAMSLMDLVNYMRGVSMPTHEYSRHAEAYVQTRTLHPQDPQARAQKEITKLLKTSTRAYSRLVLRLRLQAEAEQAHGPNPEAGGAIGGHGYTFSTDHHPAGQVRSRQVSANGDPAAALANARARFQSPLFRPRRAPLLRVFVPSPEGDWLSDDNIIECEQELDKAGLKSFLRVGDVVWDVAAGDEGNAGRLLWDGNYLIDLDFTYSEIGDIPKYLPALAFPPSYFHRVVRTGVPGRGADHGGNPIVHIDLRPFASQIAQNLQLIQDKMRMESAQGGRHNVVRWVHRSSFTIRPPPAPRGVPSRIPLPNSPGLFVDSGWYGTVVVETEGTNEGLADLQDRCGPNAFAKRAAMAVPRVSEGGRLVYRILREKSRPGEIWIKTVHDKERLN